MLWKISRKTNPEKKKVEYLWIMKNKCICGRFLRILYTSFFLLVGLPAISLSATFRNVSFSQSWLGVFFMYGRFSENIPDIGSFIPTYGGGLSFRYEFADIGKLRLWKYGGFIFSVGGRTSLYLSFGSRQGNLKGKDYNLRVFDIQGDFISAGFSWQFGAVFPASKRYLHVRINLDIINIGGGFTLGEAKFRRTSNVDTGDTPDRRRLIINIPIIPLTPSVYISYNTGETGFGIFGGANIISALSFIIIQDGVGGELKTVSSKAEFLSQKIMRIFGGITVDF